MDKQIFTLGRIQHYKNMPDLITEALKDSILQGEYKGGVQLKQDEIAKQFDVSLIPVREALIQLEALGLVNCIRNKGALVTPLSTKEMKALFELKKVLELGVIWLIKEPVKAEQLEKLGYIADKMEDILSPPAFSRYERLFYQMFCDFAENEELSKMYEELFVRIERYLIYIYHLMPHLMNGSLCPCTIMKLLREPNKEALRTYMVEHNDNIQNSCLDKISHYGPCEQFDWNAMLPFC